MRYPSTRDPHPNRRLDLVGAGFAVIGLATSTWALTEAGPRGWTDATVLGACVVSITAIAAFVRRMLRADDPLVPPALFRNHTFTIVNLQTVLLYSALGVSFFLVSYELQVATGWSALQAGVALLPATGLMLLLSASSGSLAQRIGPRLQLTVGPLIAAVGLLLLARIGDNASWVTDVLPGAIVFGLGLVTFVAPLTATVMAAADPNHVSVASGVNNAIARAANLERARGDPRGLRTLCSVEPDTDHPRIPARSDDHRVGRRGVVPVGVHRPRIPDPRTAHFASNPVQSRRRTTAARLGAVDTRRWVTSSASVVPALPGNQRGSVAALGHRHHNAAVANLAPSVSEFNLAQASDGWSRRPRPQSVEAMTFSRPTSSAKRTMRPATS